MVSSVVLLQYNTIHILILISITVNANCLYYQFKVQPPPSLNCNPYITPFLEILNLKIPCEVESLQSDDDNNVGTFDVHWIKREFDGDVTDLGRGRIISHSNDYISTELTFTHLVLDDFSLKLSGDYWCQVINTTSVPYTYLGTSNIMRVLSLEMFLNADDGPEGSCRGTKSDDTDTCADTPSKEAIDSIYGSILKVTSSTRTTSAIQSLVATSESTPTISGMCQYIHVYIHAEHIHSYT